MDPFWVQQEKALSKSLTGVPRYPFVICYYLSLATKSPASYEGLCKSKILDLPSQQTLKDHRKCIHQTSGFQEEVIEELKDLTNSYFDVQTYIVLLFDEMRITSTLFLTKSLENRLDILTWESQK